jgi:hypothetical protein
MKEGRYPLPGCYIGIKRLARLVRHYPICVREGTAPTPQRILALWISN